VCKNILNLKFGIIVHLSLKTNRLRAVNSSLEQSSMHLENLGTLHFKAAKQKSLLYLLNFHWYLVVIVQKERVSVLFSKLGQLNWLGPCLMHVRCRDQTPGGCNYIFKDIETTEPVRPDAGLLRETGGWTAV
jgi:hypothetical protein